MLIEVVVYFYKVEERVFILPIVVDLVYLEALAYS